MIEQLIIWKDTDALNVELQDNVEHEVFIVSETKDLSYIDKVVKDILNEE